MIAVHSAGKAGGFAPETGPGVEGGVGGGAVRVR